MKNVRIIRVKLKKLNYNLTFFFHSGFSSSTDLTMFQKTIPALNLSTLSVTSYLDLQELWQKLNSIRNFKFPHDGQLTHPIFLYLLLKKKNKLKFFIHTGDIHGTSLSSLVQLCLGKKLDKSNQFSNWEQRPLRKDQINYAGK